MTSLDFSMVLKTCVCTAAPDISLDIAATRTKADQGGSQRAAGAGAASCRKRTEMGLGGGRQWCYSRGKLNIKQDHHSRALD